MEYLDENGKLVTESLRDFTKNRAQETLRQPRRFPQALELGRAQAGHCRGDWRPKGLDLERHRRRTWQEPRSVRPDLPCRLRRQPPLTRRERAENVKKRDVFTKYGPQARAVLDALLEKYRDEGVLNLDDANVLKVTPFTDMGSVVQLINAFGGKAGFEKAVHELQDALYQETA